MSLYRQPALTKPSRGKGRDAEHDELCCPPHTPRAEISVCKQYGRQQQQVEIGSGKHRINGWMKMRFIGIILRRFLTADIGAAHTGTN